MRDRESERERETADPGHEGQGEEHGGDGDEDVDRAEMRRLVPLRLDVGGARRLHQHLRHAHFNVALSCSIFVS